MVEMPEEQEAEEMYSEQTTTLQRLALATLLISVVGVCIVAAFASL
jgi:hypothetical protein